MEWNMNNLAILATFGVLAMVVGIAIFDWLTDYKLSRGKVVVSVLVALLAVIMLSYVL